MRHHNGLAERWLGMIKTIGEAIEALRKVVAEAQDIFAETENLVAKAEAILSLATITGSAGDAIKASENVGASRMAYLRARLELEKQRFYLSQLEKVAAEKGTDWEGNKGIQIQSIQ